MILVRPAKDGIDMEHEIEGIAFWFDVVEPWRVNVLSARRVIWTNWFGVPLHAWNPKFFQLVATKFGKLVKIDDDTLNKNKFQESRILINTSYPEIPKTPVKVEVDGRVYNIRIKEEEEDMEDDYQDWSSDDVCGNEDEDEDNLIDSPSEELSDDEDVGDGKPMENLEKLDGLGVVLNSRKTEIAAPQSNEIGVGKGPTEACVERKESEAGSTIPVENHNYCESRSGDIIILTQSIQLMRLS